MFSTPRKYLMTLAKVVAFFLVTALVLLTVQSEITIGVQMLLLIPICLTLPVTLVWLVTVVIRKEWRAARLLALALVLPVAASVAFGLINWRILRTG